VSLPLLPEVETTDMIFPLLPVAGHTDMTLFVSLMVFNATDQQYFSYIVAVSFIGGLNRRTRRNHQPV